MILLNKYYNLTKALLFDYLLLPCPDRCIGRQEPNSEHYFLSKLKHLGQFYSLQGSKNFLVTYLTTTMKQAQGVAAFLWMKMASFIFWH